MFPRRLFEHGAGGSPEQKKLPGYRGAINDALREEMERDSSIIVMGQDVGRAPAFGVTLGLLDRFGPERVLDTPISEIAMVGAAVGAAIGGMRAVVEMQFGDFLSRAIDQVVHEGAMLRYLSGGQVKVPMVIRLPCGAGQGTGSHHAQSMSRGGLRLDRLASVSLRASLEQGAKAPGRNCRRKPLRRRWIPNHSAAVVRNPG